MQESQKIGISGGMNLDDSLIAHSGANSIYEAGDYRWALNCRIGSSSDDNRGAAENIRGTVEITDIMVWDGTTFVAGAMPSGTNKCVGRLQDRKNQRLIFLNYNSNNNHGIYRFELSDRKIYQIFISSLLNFQSTKRITEIGLIDGKLLFFTDGITSQKLINIDTIYQSDYRLKNATP